MEDAISEALETVTLCSVCTKVISDAISLPCFHIFCSSCLTPGQLGASIVPCPVCNRQFPTTEVRKDNFVKDLVDKCLTVTNSAKKICDFCADDDNNIPDQDTHDTGNGENPVTISTTHCLDCRKNLCSDCCRGHRKHCKSHVIVDIDDVTLRRRSLARFASGCHRHPDEYLKIFCYNCSKVICAVCYAEEHHGHACKDVSTAATDFHRQLKDEAQWLDTCTTKLTASLEDLEQDWRGFDERANETREKILSKGEQMKRIINDHVIKLTKELEKSRQTKFEDFELLKKAIKRLLSDVTYLKDYSLVLTENGSAYHIADSFGRMQSKAEELRLLQPHVNGFSRQILDVVFVSPDPVDRINGDTEKVLGRVSMVAIPEDVEEVKSVDERPFIEAIGTVETEARGVTGVAYFRDKLYTVCAWTNTVFVHEADPPFKKNQAILVKDMRCPNDIASCVENSCLYIVDSDTSYVWRVTASGQVDRWMSKAGQPWTISVNRGRVVLAADGKNPQLNIYGPGAGILNRVRLPSAVTPIQHAVELPNGHFIVSHGRNSGQVNRVCEISKTGNIVRVFDNLIKWPKHLSITGDDSVFVADFSSHCVLLLNRSLLLDRTVLSWENDGIDAPSRVSYTDGKGYLLLAEAASVKVYVVHGMRPKTPNNGITTYRPDLYDATKK